MYILPSAKKTQHIRKNRHSVPQPTPKHTGTRSAQRLTSNTQAYTNRSHNIPHSSKATDRNHPRHSVPYPIPKHTQIGLTTSRIPVKQQTETILGTASHIQHRSIQAQVNTLPSSTTKNSLVLCQDLVQVKMRNSPPF